MESTFISTLLAQNIPDLIPYRKGEQWGYVNTEKQLMITPQFDDAFVFDKGLARVFKDGKFGFINKKGRLVVDFIYEDPEWDKDRGGSFYFDEEGLMPVYREGLWGFMDTTGREKIHCQYEMAYNFHQGYARVKKLDKWGFINNQNKIIIPFEYHTAHDFHEGYAPVELVNNQFGVIDTLNHVIIPLEHYYIYTTRRPHGLIAVIYSKGVAGYLNLNNEQAIPFIYGNVSPFSNGLGKVYSGGAWGYIDSSGVLVIPPSYRLATMFEDSLAVVLNDSFKYGIINTRGDTIIPFTHTHIGYGLLEIVAGARYIKKPLKVSRYYLSNLREGLIPAYKENLAGAYNYEGKLIIPFEYEYIAPFENGLAIVIKDGKYGYIDRNNTRYFED